jgi:hypothetical protein
MRDEIVNAPQILFRCPAKNRVLSLAARFDTVEAENFRSLFGISKEFDGTSTGALRCRPTPALSLRPRRGHWLSTYCAPGFDPSPTKLTPVLPRVKRGSSLNPRGPRIGRHAKLKSFARKNEIPLDRQNRSVWQAMSYNNS